MVYVERISVISLADQIETEADAYLFLERLRWADKPVCSHCGSERVYYLKPANGVSRTTRTRKTQTMRRVWKCGACRKQFSVLTGTIFESTKIPLRKWLFVLFEMVANKNGIAAREIERKYHLTAKSAWFMTQRIREAMKREPLAGLLSGTIVADETYIGGKPKNRHQQGRQRPGTSKGLAGTPTDKTPVLSLIDKATGEVRSRVVPNVTGETLGPALREQIDIAKSHLHTDGGSGYRLIGREFLSHEYVEHGPPAYEFVRGDVSTNRAEGYFSQLKRSIDGTHHHVSREHLERYLAEFDFRYSSRKLTDTERLNRLMGNVGGRRLTYRPLTGC